MQAGRLQKFYLYLWHLGWKEVFKVQQNLLILLDSLLSLIQLSSASVQERWINFTEDSNNKDCKLAIFVLSKSPLAAGLLGKKRIFHWADCLVFGLASDLIFC